MTEQKLFTTPESRRKWAEVTAPVSLDAATRSLAAAVCEEAGRLREYQDAHDAWLAAEPRAEDFADEKGRAEVEAARARWEAAARKAYEPIRKMWDSYLAKKPKE